jgi:NAD(P)-dependent dehydrogenase (short-subunit alcohol dehydrogenase family)
VSTRSLALEGLAGVKPCEAGRVIILAHAKVLHELSSVSESPYFLSPTSGLRQGYRGDAAKATVDVAVLSGCNSSREIGTHTLAVVTDVSDKDSVCALADRAFATFGGVHILCNLT